MHYIKLINLIVSLCLYNFACIAKEEFSFFKRNGKKITIVVEKNDITKCSVQAIVNAANPQLLAGAGVCGAIFSAAGIQKLQKACNDFYAHGANAIRCSVGQAVITDSFNLSARGIEYIIHAVGPDCREITNINQQNLLLTQVYISALSRADEKQLKSIAFPFISSAIYAFPRERAANIAVDSVLNYLFEQSTTLQMIHFVLFSLEDYELFCKTIANRNLSEVLVKKQ